MRRVSALQPQEQGIDISYFLRVRRSAVNFQECTSRSAASVRYRTETATSVATPCMRPNTPHQGSYRALPSPLGIELHEVRAAKPCAPKANRRWRRVRLAFTADFVWRVQGPGKWHDPI